MSLSAHCSEEVLRGLKSTQIHFKVQILAPQCSAIVRGCNCCKNLPTSATAAAGQLQLHAYSKYDRVSSFEVFSGDFFLHLLLR